MLGVNRYIINKQLSLFITVLSPISGLVCTILHWRSKWAKNISWLICVFLGLIFIYHPEGTMLGDGIDAGRYALDLYRMYNLSSLSAVLGNIWIEGGNVDLYQPILTFIVSRFTDDPHVLFACFSLVFGFFYTRNLWYVFDRLPLNLKKYTWILILFYILICPIWNINGVRMWTALHIFIYGAMPFVYEGNKSKLLFCVLALFVHFSFFIPLIILIFYSFLKVTNLNALFAFYIVTLFIKEIDVEFIRNLLVNVPIVGERMLSYVGEMYMEKVVEAKEQLSLHVVLANKIAYWIVQFYIVLTWMAVRKSYMVNEKILKLFSFSLLIYGISNILALIPSGGRFVILSHMFVLPTIIFSIEYLYNDLIKKCNVVLPVLLFSIIFQLRVGIDYYGASLLICNYLTAFFIQTDVPIISWIKNLI